MLPRLHLTPVERIAVCCHRVQANLVLLIAHTPVCDDCLLFVMPGKTPDEVAITSWRPFELWSAPEVYNMILKAAHDGAQAMVDSPSGQLMHMVSNVMVRVDVVLGAHWDNEGQISLWPMVNEMDWFNSAAMLTNFWKGSLPAADTSAGQAGAFGLDSKGELKAVQQMQQSAGFKVAQALYKEVVEAQHD